MVLENNMTVKSEAEIREWEKNDYVNGIKIDFDSLFYLINEHVQNYVQGEKRDFTENEKKIDYFVCGCLDNVKIGFKNLETSIWKSQHEILSHYTEQITTKQNLATFEINDNMTQYKKELTRSTNKLNRSIKDLIEVVNSKRQYTEELLFLQEVNDIFDEIQFGHVMDYDTEYLKIAGFGYYRNKRIESRFTRDTKTQVARIHEIINNPKPARTSEQIHRDNAEFFDRTKRETKNYVEKHIEQVFQTDSNSWYNRVFTCKHCKKQFFSSGSKLNMGKSVKNIIRHLEKEHDLSSEHDWHIYRTLEDQTNG